MRGINALDEARQDQVTFIMNPRHARRWADSAAAAALVTEGVEGFEPGADGRRPIVLVENAEAACVTVLELFRPAAAIPEEGVHPSSFVHEQARIAPDARIGPHVTIDQNCIVGPRTVLHAGVRLYHGVRIGSDCILHANCVIRERCTVGDRVIINANATIGSDGFGLQPAEDGLLTRVPHIGIVAIEDDVEIGAGTCVDRGKFGPTRIGRGAQLDNLVQVGHNCTVGPGAVIAGHTGIAGSCEIGERAILAGHVGVADHRTVGAGAVVGAKSGVHCDIPPGEQWLGYPARPASETLRVWGRLRKLPVLFERLGRRPDGDGGRRASSASPGSSTR
ncbi:MAG: UDP-3-O-(3-hydroxymyristoyl)glucosamine N-acyltransferase [Planctomycetota bacterium]